MKVMEVDVFSETSNCPILRFPGRQFPGLLIQGDTLKNIAVAVDTIKALDPKSDEYRAELSLLEERLASLVTHYETTLRHHKMKLPYPESYNR